MARQFWPSQSARKPSPETVLPVRCVLSMRWPAFLLCYWIEFFRWHAIPISKRTSRMKSNFQLRRARLAQKLKGLDAAAALITNPVNVRYLTGFTGDSSYLLLSDKRQILLSDTRYQTQIAGECPNLEVEIRDASTTTDELAGKVVSKLGIRSLAVEADSITKAAFDKLAEQLKSAQLLETIGLVAELRPVKDASEIATIRQSIRVAERTMQVILAELSDEQTELEVAHNLEHKIRRLGGGGCSFEPIVGVGKNSALPTAGPQRRESGNRLSS